ncbi:Zn-dependent hydrolase [Bosea sp. PAMC 26642]|uniref:Zn-dependent hydrolase n=1 Tax=Bosea sp. (strain PAMC 26642) TaxID=1792307 RepID=UPI00077048F4|nr:Zn-dependent hydrolase [Bosea sp. PAMC 26642]AMJ63642.1 allantoate amidohydrolase [Bosea sp. PAMC 26642]
MPAATSDALRAAIAAQRPWIERFFDDLAAGSRGDPGIMRDTYGEGENFGHRLLAEHVQARGLDVTRDFAANTYVTLRGSNPAAPRILMGSHLDSVPHGGNFDGAAGVIAGLVVIDALRALGLQPRCDVTAMGVRAEESVWFQVSYIGSRSALGTLPEGALSSKRIDDGRVLADSIAACGGDPDAIRRRERHLDPASIRAFLEVHIEQAPSLVASKLPVAICSGVPGNFRYPDACIIGRHDHVGTPRRFRRDAAMAGAELAMTLDRIWEEEEAAGVPLAVTFGRFHTDPALHGMTTVPGAFAFSLDVRAYDPAVLERVERRMLDAIAEIETRRRVTFALGARASAAVGPVDPGIAAEFESAARRHGIPTMRLGSPASHDCAAFAAAGVPIAMLFVRNEHGSHNPLEAMEIDDFLDACTVLADWVVGEVA